MKTLTSGLIAVACLLAVPTASGSSPLHAGPKSSAGSPVSSARIKKSHVSIAHTQFKLKNGLTVIFHEDHSQPLVTLNINVQVGSRDEPSKRTGFAHLFEHLMFMGTQRVPEKMFDTWMEAEGGWNNAWTSNDRTDYYDVGPRHILPLLLWMEADRLRSLGRQIDQAKLDTQRGVVRNERRQTSENRPYAGARLVLPTLLFPVGHPYHHPVIGSHADLAAASVGDVRAFFRKHYVPSNMSLVVAGDFEPTSCRTLVDTYFGSIPASNQRHVRPAPTTKTKLRSVVRHTMQDDVTLPKLINSWLSPALYASGDAELDLLADILTAGKASRLYRSLVYDKKLAQSVSAYQSSKSLRSNFNIEAVARPNVSLEQLQEGIDQVLASVRSQGVTAKELGRAKNDYETNFVSRMQSLATRASLLNGYFASRGQADWADADLQRYIAATPQAVQQAAQATLDPHARVILHIVPREPTSK